MNENQTVPAAILERSAKALYEWDFIETDRHVPVAWEEVPNELRAVWYSGARAVLEAVYGDIQAEALREVAEEWAEGAWSEEFILAGVVDDVTAVQATAVWLNARADRLAGA